MCWLILFIWNFSTEPIEWMVELNVTFISYILVSWNWQVSVLHGNDYMDDLYYIQILRKLLCIEDVTVIWPRETVCFAFWFLKTFEIQMGLWCIYLMQQVLPWEADAHLVKKSLALYQSCVLSWVNWTHCTPPFIKIHFNIILMYA